MRSLRVPLGPRVGLVHPVGGVSVTGHIALAASTYPKWPYDFGVPTIIRKRLGDRVLTPLEVGYLGQFPWSYAAPDYSMWRRYGW